MVSYCRASSNLIDNFNFNLNISNGNDKDKIKVLNCSNRPKKDRKKGKKFGKFPLGTNAYFSGLDLLISHS